MTVFTFIQIAVNIAFVVGLIVVWNRSTRRTQDDPRLSRGLQLLQSKISVLEDLSDRTDLQVKQLIKLIENKTRHLQTKIFESEKQMQRIDQSMHKSLEVANIFQDKIPHEEIIERQNSVKYVQAAQLAHQGKTVDEIVKLVGLTKGEVEFIAKVNKDELMFDSESLPAWTQQQVNPADVDTVDKLIEQNYEKAFQAPTADLASLEKLGEEFRTACRDYDEEVKKEEEQLIDLSPQFEKAKEWTKEVAHQAGDMSQKIASQTGEITKKALDSSVEATRVAAHKTSEISHKIAKPAAEAIQEASTKLTEKATKTFEKLMDSSDGEIDGVNPFNTHQLSFEVDMEEERVTTPTPMASHQQAIMDAVMAGSKEQPVADESRSLSEMLDAPKKADDPDEVKKVVFPNVEDSPY